MRKMMSLPEGTADELIYPLVRGQLYTVAALRAAETSLLAERQADQGLSSRLRLQKRKEIDWAKIRNEEWSPLMLLADGLRLGNTETFCWTPDEAADFEITSSGKTLNIQCTMAYDQLTGAKYQGGKLHHMEMLHSSRNGFYFGGGGISEPTARDVLTDLATWRAGIVAAVETKLEKASYRGRELDLLVYARGCAFDLIDFDFAEIVQPALDSIGKDNWGRTFSNVYVVDNGSFASVSSRADKLVGR
jgi:hypothetical protein